MALARFAAAAAVVLFSVRGSAQPAEVYQAEPDQVLASYELSLGSSRISGTSGSLEWSIAQAGDGGAHIRLRLQVDSFRTSHPAVDAVVREAMESRRFPIVEIEGYALAAESTLRGTMTMHGVSRPFKATLSRTRVGDRLLLQTSLSVALDAFGVTAPRVGPATVGNVVEVSVIGLLRVHPNSVVSGGAVNADG